MEADFQLKARLLAKDPYMFFRGTFYRWMQLFPEICQKPAKAPVVLSVGDVHASNFGTWHDAKGDLVWGINDFDEAVPLPYTQDLIRLATSVELASATHRLKINLIEACEAILDGYCEALEKGGKPFVINEDHDWLYKVYGRNTRQAAEYWEKLNQLPAWETEAPAVVRTMLESALPVPGMTYRLVHRQAGVGSLGRPRFMALAECDGALVAREVKALIPSAALWARKQHQHADIYYEEVLACAVRRLDPIMKVYEGWVMRGLAHDSCRIGLSELGPERDEMRMMHAMGWETANIHLGTRAAVKDVLVDLKERKPNWLVKSAEKMTAATVKDWGLWRNR